MDSLEANEIGTWYVSATAIIDWGNGTVNELQSNRISFNVGTSSSNLLSNSLSFILPTIIVLVVVFALAFFYLRRKKDYLLRLITRLFLLY